MFGVEAIQMRSADVFWGRAILTKTALKVQAEITDWEKITPGGAERH